MSDRYLLGKIPYGKYHDAAFGRMMWVSWRVTRAITLAGVIAAFTWNAVDDPGTAGFILAFAALMASLMDGSVYSNDRERQ